MNRALVLCGFLAASACAPVPMSPERAADICEEKARAAQGPTGSVTVGTNSDDGPFSRVEIGVNSDFLRGLDPMEVYVDCVFERTGAAPIRPPRLR
ncbi:MAG: hypothetical protein KJP02_09605 [Octadecabacter sp.]|nr:hypothetical protein [Octadecabacter sp.]